MNEIKDHVNTCYWCAYSDDLKVFHIGILEVGRFLTTGQPHLESFDTEAELEMRVDELKGEGYYQSQKNEVEE